MADEQKQEAETAAVVPVETEQVDFTQTVNSGDPEYMLSIMKKKAALAPEFKKARDTLLVAMTYPEDWEVFGQGDKARVGLSSAGAERIGTMFDMQHQDVNFVKEDFVIEGKEYYRYIYTGHVVMGLRKVYVTGMFSTRDKFLGFANGEWRTKEEINENNIRIAAYHVFCGNAVKAMLGLRGIPKREWELIMGRTGSDSKNAGGHSYGGGTQGGTSKTDGEKQKELAEGCIAIVNAGMFAEPDGKYWKLCKMNDMQAEITPIELAKDLCRTISSFKGKDGSTVVGKLASELKGKRLDVTLGTSRKLLEKLES